MEQGGLVYTGTSVYQISLTLKLILFQGFCRALPFIPFYFNPRDTGFAGFLLYPPVMFGHPL